MSWKLRAAVTALLLAPQAAFALGLGDIRLNSSLNEPMAAEIDLVAPTADELGSLSAQLASRELFQRYGLDRPGYLDSMTFSVGQSRDGRSVLKVSSAAPISEPFVTFLVEVNWPRGRLLREYTVLLDPPVFTPRETVAQAPVAAPTTARAATSPPRPAAAAARPAPAAAGDMPDSYRVQRGDTLYGIAAGLTGGNRADVNRMMLALFRENPEAFDGNVNLLRAGALLRTPAAGTLDGIGSGEASAEISRQTAAWRGAAAASEAGRLRLVTPDEGGVGAGESAATAAGGDVGSRVDALAREIEESQRLLELKNAELARLQQELEAREAAQQAEAAAAAAAAAEAPVAAEPEAPAAETPATEAPVSEAPVDETLLAEEPEAPAAAEPEEKPAAEAKPAAAPAEPSFFDALTDNWTYLLGAAALLLGGVFAFGYLRRRREEDLDEALRTFDTGTAPVPSETQRLRALALGEAEPTVETPAIHVEEGGATERKPVPRKPAKAAAAPMEDTLSAEAPISLDQADPMAEADFHMAYGLYDQAADIVKLALDKEPERRDYKVKLLEIYFVAGNKPSFLDLASELHSSRSAGDAGEWERIAIMGRQLAPEESMFEGAKGGAGAGVDLNLEGGEGHIDLELLAPPDGDDMDLDLGAALGAADSASETGKNEVLDFDLEDRVTTAEMPKLGEGTAEMPTIELPAADSPTAELPIGDSLTTKLKWGDSPTAKMPKARSRDDEPTVEQAKLQPLRDDATVKEQVDRSRFSSAPVSSDSTAEMPMDDLGIDLGDLEALAGGPADAEDEETLIADGLDDATQLADSLDDSTRLAESIGADDETRIARFDEPTRMMPGLDDADDVGGTSIVRSLDDSAIDLDLSDFEESAGDDDLTGKTGIMRAPQLDTSTPAGRGNGHDDADYTATERVALEDLPEMSELEPVTMSEVGTKLDLARAYVDMGDPDGARSILQEVLKEGSNSQRQEAKRLLDSLPGA